MLHSKTSNGRTEYLLTIATSSWKFQVVCSQAHQLGLRILAFSLLQQSRTKFDLPWLAKVPVLRRRQKVVYVIADFEVLGTATPKFPCAAGNGVAVQRKMSCPAPGKSWSQGCCCPHDFSKQPPDLSANMGEEHSEATVQSCLLTN